MKSNFNLSLVIAAGILALGLIIAANLSGSSSISIAESEQAPVITVSGSGSIEVPPNEARVMVRIETKASNAKDSQEANAAITDTVLDALRDAGIRKDDIETSSFSIREDKQFDRNLGRSVSMGFVSSHLLSVTTTAVDDTGSIIDVSTKAGATGIDFVTFTLDEETQREVRDQALAEAVAEAQSKADLLAQQLGVKRGRVHSISESSFFQPVQRSGILEIAAETVVLPGDVSVTASVTAQYLIE